MSAFEPDTAKRIQSWLQGPCDSSVKKEIERLLREDPGRLADAFFKVLSFGTGGMRGIMGVGTNRMNLYTVQMATQGLARYLKRQFPKEQRVFIGYDVRLHSKEFAEAAARVLAGNEIHAYVTKEVCPTPLASFGCRLLHCHAAIVITASHNPPQYNGYKVYWSDGGQVVFPHDAGIMEEVQQIEDLSQIALAPSGSPFIHWVGEELDAAYLAALEKRQLLPELPKDLQIVYTNLHGTGRRLVPAALKRWGYNSLSLVEKQAPFDGNFPSAPSPNPEEAKALSLGIEQMLQKRADLLLATDPDADRVSAAVRENGKAVLLTGHQIGCLCLYHLCSTLTKKGKMPKNAACIKSIVTTELFRKIAESFHVSCFDVLTGFKYVGEKIKEWEKSSEYHFLFGAEESYGYLFGTDVRDKDAISTCCLLAEAASAAKEEGMSLVLRLYHLYRKYGIHREALSSLVFDESRAGAAKMRELMHRLRQTPPQKIGGCAVTKVDDYLELQTGFPRSDVLCFWLEDKSKIVIRPSGTEPKVKIYAETFLFPFSDLEKGISQCDERLKTLLSLDI